MGVIVVVVVDPSFDAVVVVLPCSGINSGTVDQAPPRVAAASKTQHFKPLASKCLAVTSPAEPAPMTATSIIAIASQ